MSQDQADQQRFILWIIREIELNRGKPLRIWFIQFSDETRCHGFVVVMATCCAHALCVPAQLGIRPGGSMFAGRFVEGQTVAGRWFNRLLTPLEFKAALRGK